ncbi:hypothetical protein TNCT_659001 [Trichonephila clavata]|uniref:Uncharacterized protein n=1 Tax=Trichonephila clavata TaxID=2740835 RepID=A0A8X6HGT0_TRICU|nr:hypothetical protein TNCT_659001 [Trichonephila clavata]
MCFHTRLDCSRVDQEHWNGVVLTSFVPDKKKKKMGVANGRLRVSQNGDFEPPADPQIEALVLHLELKNEDSTTSIERRPRCPADFVK